MHHCVLFMISLAIVGIGISLKLIPMPTIAKLMPTIAKAFSYCRH